MKKTLSTILLSAMVLGTVATSVSAVEFTDPANPTTTTGDATFKPKENVDGGNPVGPEDGGSESVTPVDPNNPDGGIDGGFSSGPLRIEFVPNFHFGELEHTTNTQEYPAIWPVQVDADGNQTNTAHFAQVTDETGNATQKWQLEVSQTTPFTNGASVLENTRIKLYAGSIYNSNSANAAATDELLTMPTIDGAAGEAIPMTADGSVKLLQVKEGKGTNGSQSSFVFADKTVYNETDKSVTTEKNEQLKLMVPKGDNTVNGTYEATFTWTLNDTY